jgi:hypothetical protein
MLSRTIPLNSSVISNTSPPLNGAYFLHIVAKTVCGNPFVQCLARDGILGQHFYVTDGNIMYLTDASRFLISCVIQHYAPVVGWGGGGTDA